ncbi:MAG: hypothetical protein ABIN61_08665 [candidate division WOR-3 bacterium]
MSEREGIILHFDCCLDTPFHSTEKKYKNLLKCSPYILGSSIRGELLNYLIIKNCTANNIRTLSALKKESDIIEFHSKCEIQCIVKKFLWNEKWGILLSFGQFERPQFRAITRIAISRESRASSGGGIVNIEQIRDGCNFSVEIVLCNDEQIIDDVKSAFKVIGLYFGIGKYKNVAMGRFSIKNMSIKKVKDVLNEKITEFRQYEKKQRLTFITPFLLHNNSGLPIDLDQNQFAALFSKMLLNRSKELSEFFNLNLNVEPTVIDSIRTYIIPDYVSRYSLEESTKKNRLVAKAGSYFDCYFGDSNQSLPTQLALCSLFGVGEWADIGFGRFSIEG